MYARPDQRSDADLTEPADTLGADSPLRQTGAAHVKAWAPMGTHPEDYEFGIDRSAWHGGKASALLKSKSATRARSFGGIVQVIDADDFRGQRLRLSGYVKAEGVTGWAGLWLRIDGPEAGQITALDNMHERSIRGTSDWARYELVLDVPLDAAILAFGALLDGAGQIWVDDLRFDIVDASVPTTGAQVHHLDRNAKSARPQSRQPQNLGFEESESPVPHLLLAIGLLRLRSWSAGSTGADDCGAIKRIPAPSERGQTRR